MWFFLALLSTILFGFSTFFIKKGYKYLSVTQTMAVEAIVGFFLTGIYLFFRRDFQWTQIGLIFLLCLIGYGVYYLYLLTYEKSQLVVASTVIAATPIGVTVLAYFFLKQQITSWGFCLIFLIVLGIILIGCDPNQMKKLMNLKQIKFKKIFLWSLFGLIANIMMDVVDGKILTFTTPVTLLVVLVPTEFIFVGILLAVKRERFDLLNKKPLELKNTLIGTGFMTVATICYFEAIAIGKLGYISAITSSSVIISIFLGLTFLKEKVTRLQILGMSIVVLGVMLFGLT